MHRILKTFLTYKKYRNLKIERNFYEKKPLKGYTVYIFIDVKPRQLPGPSDWDLFCLLANCFLLFCSHLAVLVFPTLFIG